VIRVRDTAGNADSSLSPDTRLSRDVAAIILVALLALVLWLAAANAGVLLPVALPGCAMVSHCFY
jgi:hypothetical protein